MVTRKAISTAFEIIASDYEVVDVCCFVFRNGQPTDKITRVLVTRDMEFPNKYTVELGLLNKGEREWFERETEMHGVSPRLSVRNWMYAKEKAARRRRKGRV